MKSTDVINHVASLASEFERREKVAARANSLASQSRTPGAPRLSATSSADDVSAWLQWCDPNGAHTVARALAEDVEPYDDDAAWLALSEMVSQ